jgi:hypothetical protein
LIAQHPATARCRQKTPDKALTVGAQFAAENYDAGINDTDHRGQDSADPAPPPTAPLKRLPL